MNKAERKGLWGSPRIYIVSSTFLLSFSSAVLAQETPKSDYGNQAIAQRLTQEINLSLQTQAQVLLLQEENKKLREELSKQSQTQPKPEGAAN